MIRKLAKLYAYSRMPTATFVALHPIKTVKLLSKGVIALPLGIYLGTKLLEGGKQPHAHRA
ncbi:MAG TPA: hypothetical protein VMK65_11350 [Longimicrobiales bacterium]|nr:hypothetical protein [Longimicrobiales bacterium]